MKIFAKTQVRSLALALALAMGMAQGVGAQPADPASVLIAWERVAFGSTQDIDAALALMTDDAVLTVTPPPAGTPGVWTGKAEIRQALQYNKEQNVKRENVGTPRVEGDKATITSMVSNNFFQSLGVAPVENTTEVLVEGGKIKSYTSTMSPSERGRVAAAVAARQGAQPGPATDPASVLIAWERVAFGSTQDINAALALMTDDVVLTVLPAPPGQRSTWTGKAEITQALQFNKQLNVQRENVGSPRVEGNKVTVTAMVTNNNLVMWGVAPVEHTTEVVVEGGKIKSYTSTMAPSERERVAAAAAAYQQAQQPAQPPAGMPSTGGEQPVPFSLLAVLGMLAAVTGLGMRLRPRTNLD